MQHKVIIEIEAESFEKVLEAFGDCRDSIECFKSNIIDTGISIKEKNQGYSFTVDWEKENNTDE